MRRVVCVCILIILAVLSTAACSPDADCREGLVVWGHEVRSFRPCDSEKDLWLVGSQEVLERLISDCESLTDVPYTPIYVELCGMEGPQATDGFAADYDGVFTVISVVNSRKATEDDCRAK